MRAMKRPSRRTTIIAAVAVVAVFGIAGGAIAASGTFDPAQEKQAFLNDAAGRLGTTSDKLEAALKAAAIDRVNAALAAGEITQDQANAIKDAINSGQLPLSGGLPLGGFGLKLHRVGFGGPVGKVLEGAASYLGLTQDQLLTQLRSGKTLADIAKAQGKTVSGLEDAITSGAQTQLDQAVKAGKLTQAEADQIMAGLKSHLDALVNGTVPGPTSGVPGPGPAFKFGWHMGERFGGSPTAGAADARFPTA
jgi:hypothetical protein